MIYAIDFDGTLCTNAYPNIGKKRRKWIAYTKRRKKQGHKIILWTCRVGDKLTEAVQWCKHQRIYFDAVNENLQSRIDIYGGDTRKISADFYVDDRNIKV